MRLNHIVTNGRITRDPELKTLKDGTEVLQFSIAVEDNITDKVTNKNKVYYIPVVAWKHTAKYIATYAKKGTMLVVEGKLTSRTYQTKEGKNATAIEVVADHVDVINYQAKTEAVTGQQQQNTVSVATTVPQQPLPEIQTVQPAYNETNIDNLELPFM